MEQKTCGLFDSGVTSEADGKVSLVTDNLPANFTDFFPFDENGMEKNFSEANLFDLPTPEVSGLDDLPFDFGETFVDLSEFLLGGNNESGKTPMNVDLPSQSLEMTPGATAPACEAPKANRKRPLTDTDELDAVFTSTIDHCDYTKKRPRLSTVSSDISDCESTVSCTSSSISYTAAEKKVQRRMKNNIASRRSRQTRKNKFIAMEEEAFELEQKNKELALKVKELEDLTAKMKAVLVQRLSMSSAFN